MKIALITDDGNPSASTLVVRLLSSRDNRKWQVVQRETRNKMGHSHFSSQESGEHKANERHGFDPASQSRHVSMAQAIADCEAIICAGWEPVRTKACANCIFAQ